MSNRRAILFLLAGIGLLVSAHIAIDCAGSRRTSAGRREFLVSSADAAVRLTIKRQSAPTVALVRTDGGWRLDKPFSDSADESAVKKLVDALAFTPVIDAISESDLLKLGGERADFVVGGLKVSVSREGSDSVDEITFGSKTPDGGGVYATVTGEDAVFVVPVSVFSAVDVPADGFRARSLCGADPNAISSFDVRRGPAGVATFVRDGEGWKTENGNASSQKVKQYLSALASAEAAGFVWPTGATNEAAAASEALLAGYGLDPENAVTVTLKDLGGGASQVSFGKAAGDDLVYALVRGGAVVVTVASSLKDPVSKDGGLLADSRIFTVEARGVSAFTVAGDGVSCALARGADGAWKLESPVAAPADAAVVDAVLARLLALSPAEAEKSGVSVALPAESTPVSVSRKAALGDVRFEDFRSKEVVKIDPALVKRLVRTSGGRSLAVVYARDQRAWNVETEGEAASVDEKGIMSVLSSLNPLVAVRVERLKASEAEHAAYGLDNPFLTLAIDQDREDAVRRNLILGGLAPDGGRFATVGAADAVFVLSDEAVRRLSRRITEDGDGERKQNVPAE